MGKKKSTTINNITNIHMVIDYDKLAIAIIEANKMSEEEVQRKKSEENKIWIKSLGFNDTNQWYHQ